MNMACESSMLSARQWSHNLTSSSFKDNAAPNDYALPQVQLGGNVRTHKYGISKVPHVDFDFTQLLRRGFAAIRHLRTGLAVGVHLLLELHLPLPTTRSTMIPYQAEWTRVEQFYQQMDPVTVDEHFLWSRLEPLLDHLPESELRQVQEALHLAYDAHSGQFRRSGEPFITHPVEVTRILAEIRSERDTLIAGLLHDTVEDTDYVSLEEIENWFGYDSMRIVEAETKFSKLTQLQSNASKEDLKAMDLQQLFLAMTEDARIIVVKLADRLHNMRTMASMPPEKQRRIAAETLAVFAPLAHLLGLWSIKTELEDLSFKYFMPGVHALVDAHRQQLLAEQGAVIQEARAHLSERLNSDEFLMLRCGGVEVECQTRSLYSLFKRAKAELQKKLPHVPISEVPIERIEQLLKVHQVLPNVTDIAQLRVVISESPAPAAAGLPPPPLDAPHGPLSASTSVQLCYQVLGVLHSLWAPVPGSIKDFISTPKRNGYQGLHSSLLTLGCSAIIPVEVHVRTESMQRLADYGIAADSWSMKSAAAAPDAGAADALRDRQPAACAAVQSGEGASGGPAHSGGADAAWGPAAHSGNGVHTARAGNGSAGAARGSGPATGGADGNGSGAGRCGNGASDNGSAARGCSGAVLGSGAHAPPPSGSSAAGPSAQARENPQAGTERSGGGRCEQREGSEWTLRGARLSQGTRLGKAALLRRVNWLNSIREWQEEFLGSLSAQEFVQCIRDDLLGSTVFVFTPSGDIMRLPKGATVVDFAYHVHSAVGNSMVSAKVNGSLVKPSYELRNADVVEVVQYSSAVGSLNLKRHREWLSFAKTRSARYKLNKFLKENAAAVAPSDLPDSRDGSFDDYDGDNAVGGPVDLAGNQGAPGSEGSTTWLVVECSDRSGILAEVAAVIASNGHNIQAYSGDTPDQQDTQGVAYMNFQLTGNRVFLPAMCEQIRQVNAVTNISVGAEEAQSFDGNV